MIIILFGYNFCLNKEMFRPWVIPFHLVILFQGVWYAHGDVKLRVLDAKTAVFIECISNTDITISFTDKSNTSRIIAECDVDLRSCELKNTANENNYNVLKTGLGAILIFLNEQEEFLGTYTFCETFKGNQNCASKKMKYFYPNTSDHNHDPDEPIKETERPYCGDCVCTPSLSCAEPQTWAHTIITSVLAVTALLLALRIGYDHWNKAWCLQKCISKNGSNERAPPIELTNHFPNDTTNPEEIKQYLGQVAVEKNRFHDTSDAQLLGKDGVHTYDKGSDARTTIDKLAITVHPGDVSEQFEKGDRQNTVAVEDKEDDVSLETPLLLRDVEPSYAKGLRELRRQASLSGPDSKEEKLKSDIIST